MDLDKPASYSASFRNFELRTWETSGRYSWTVKNTNAAEQIAEGDAADLSTAMVAAAEAAGADWGSVKWRGRADQSDEFVEAEDGPEVAQS